MTTTLIALTLPSNLERVLLDEQTRLFRERGLVSARVLPPLIPLTWTDAIPPDHELDRLRRSHDATLRTLDAAAFTTACTVVPIADHGVSTLRLAVANVVRKTAGPADLAHLPAAIVLAWEQSAPVACSLPGTSALWLTVFEVTADAARDRWWHSVTWCQWYRRRLRNPRRSDGPPPGAPR